MAAVTQRIPNYLSGVSKQADSKKLPGQVKECINGLPDVTLGMTKRPGFKFISKLKNTSGTDFSGTQLDNAKWFYINRDTSTRYIGCITPKVGGTNGSLYVWNADTGAACTITNGSTHTYLTGIKTNYDVTTVQDTTIICNDAVTVTTQAAATDFVAQSRGTVLLSLLGQLESSIQSTDFEIKLGGTAILAEKSSVQTCTYTSGASDDYDAVLDGLKAAIVAKSITGLTVEKYGTSLQIDYVVSSTRTPFTLEAKGGADNERITVFQDWANNESWLPPNSFHNHVVTIVNSPLYDEDNYYAKFVADNGAAGSGYWKESLGNNQSPGLTAATMPHRLRNTGTNTFVFEPITWGDRLVGDDLTNLHPSFVGKTIKKTFWHDDRLGFISEDNVILSRAKEPYELYAVSARTHTAGDPIDVNCASTRPTKLHAVKPARQGLLLFSKSQQFVIYSDDGPLTPQSTKIRPVSNMEMSDTVDPIDIGTHFNFISKTPNFVRVFALQPRGLGENPDILDIGRVVNEWITIDVDTLVASIQNEFIAMSAQDSNEIYFYRTYSDGKDMLMESWFKWSLHGTVQSMALDQDDMYVVTKQGNQYTISKANLTQSPEVAIITNAQGQKINPCMDLYAQAAQVRYRNVESTTITAGGSGYSSAPTVTFTAPFSGTTATGTATISGGAVTGITMTNVGVGYESAPTITFSGGGGNGATATATVDAEDRSKCYLPYANLTDEKNVLIVSGTTAAGTFNNSGFTITPETGTDSVGTYFKVPGQNLTSIASNVYVGYAYNFDMTLPQVYYQLDQEGRSKDFTASLTVSRFKFDVGLSGVLGFKLNATGRFAGKREYTGDNSTTNFNWNVGDLDYVDKDQVKVKVNNVLKTLGTDYTFPTATKITFNSAPYTGDKKLIYLDEWYQLQPVTSANTYLADDVPLDESVVFTLPIHQRSKNFTLRVFNDSPFPVSLNSMMWEGNYSPRFYRRT